MEFLMLFKYIRALIAGALVLFSSQVLLAVEITIDTNNYVGVYRFNGGGHYGTKTFDVSPGAYTINIVTNTISFELNSDGTITSQSDRVILAPNKLTFQTVPVVIAPGLYDMQINLAGRYHALNGSKTTYLLPEGTSSDDTNYKYRLGLGDQSNGVFFTVSPTGELTMNSSRFQIQNLNEIHFQTTPINIDTSGFELVYNTMGRYRRDTSGSRTVHLLPEGTGSDDFGNRYKFNVSGDRRHGFVFYLDTNGHISTQSTKVTLVDPTTMKFNLVPINIDTNGYTSLWNITGYNTTGNQTINVVPAGTSVDDFGDLIQVLLGRDANGFRMSVDSQGNLSADSTRVTTTGNTVKFTNMANVTFTPDNLTKNYRLNMTTYQGELTIPLLLPGTGSSDFGQIYRLEDKTFNLADPCAILPSENITTSTGINFTVTCEELVLDADEDGFPDTEDNCPAIANPNQIDLDEDGLGDACDDDLDGDSINNNLDNCPDTPNLDQLDTDGDLIGDACDDDLDGDSVPSDIDNCPLISNPLQENSDSDAQGDACDSDDDNDLVLDTADNCPVISNPDQLDLDGDGDGDACDGDRDGDGIANALDSCPATALGALVNEQGCSGLEFVELTCPEASFSNHGQFVSCVAKLTKSLVEEGLMTQKERSQLIKVSAKKK